MKKTRKLVPLLCLLVGCGSMTACKRAARVLGPKDEGGSYLILSVRTEEAQERDSAVAETMRVMERRCDELGIYCKTERAQNLGPDKFKLRISATDDPERVKKILLAEGLEIREVVSQLSPYPFQTYATREEAAAAAGADKDVLPYLEHGYPTRDNPEGPAEQKFIVVERTPVVMGRHVIDARAENRRGGERDYEITFRLNSEGASRLGNWSASHINYYLAVVLDRQARSVAYVKSPITDSGVISGRFTERQAEDIALVLRSGGLPAPVEIVEEGAYKP